MLVLTHSVGKAQCVDDYVGTYGVFDCETQLYSHNSNVAQWGNWTFTINNFVSGFSQSQILIGQIDCTTGYVEFDSTHYNVGTSHWVVGDGMFNQDSLIVNLRHYFWHPVENEWNGPNNDCWVYNRLESGVNDLSQIVVQLIPNPAHETLEIQTETRLGNGLIRIYDMFGGLVKEVQIDSKIDVSSLSSGIYVLELETEEFTFTRKFAVQK